MSQNCNLESLNYYCNCLKVQIPQAELTEHLKLRLPHKISRVFPSIHFSEDIKKSILEKIEAVSKIQNQIQLSSINLTKTIILNSELAVNKLSQLITIYKKIILDQNYDKQLQSKEITSNHKINDRLKVSLIDHFDQEIVNERLLIDNKIGTIKKKIFELFNKNCSSFSCLTVFSCENFLVTGGYDGFIRIWDAANNTQSYCLPKYKGDVYSVTVGSRDEIILAGYGDCAVRLWDLKSKKMVHKFVGHSGYINTVLILDGNKTGFSGSWDCTIKIWNLEKKEIEKTIDTFFQINHICFINNQNILVAVGTKGSIFFWNKSTEVAKNSVIKGNFSIKCCSFTKDESKLILGKEDGSVQILLTSNLKLIFEDKKHTEEINSISISYNSQYFATSSPDKQVIIWDLSKKCLVHCLKYKNTIQRAAFLKQSDFIIICLKSSQIMYFDLGKIKNEIKIAPKHLYDVEIAISSNLNYIAYSISKINLFNLETNKSVTKILNYLPMCACIKFSPDSSYLICGYFKGEVLMLSVPSLIQIKKFHLHTSQILCASMSSNNKFIASACSDNKFLIQSVEENQVMFTDYDVFVECAVFCYNDKRVVYCVRSCTVHVVDENFKKVRILNFDNMTYRVLPSEDDQSFIVSDTQSIWSCVNAKTSEKIFENKSRKEFKKISSEKKDCYWKVFVNLVGINF